MEKHTKGPWKISEHLDTGEPVIRDSEDYIIANCGAEPFDNKECSEQEANARLIAASPELLQACKYVVQYHREKDSGEGELFGLDFVTTCISAINKAERRIKP